MILTSILVSLVIEALLASSNPLPLAQASSSPYSSTSNGTSEPDSSSSTSPKGGCQFAGVNIAGFDFGADNSGVPNGPSQIQHFVNDDKQNLFRLPVEWDYLTATSSSPIQQDKFFKYDELMQACLKTGAHCILDIHSYARFSGTSQTPTVGQPGGPSIDDLVNLWTQLAKFYAADENVIMGIMNEPNGVDLGVWSQAVQACVNAIRGAGATKQMILLPGTDWDSAAAWSTDGSASALLQITNPNCASSDTACRVANLVFDFHYYFGPIGSAECDNDGTSAFNPPLDLLRKDPLNIRRALVTELGGGGSTASCLQQVCAALDILNENSDVYLGWTVWSAGAFDASYVLSVLDAQGQDVPLMKQCFVAKSFGGKAGGGAPLIPGGGGGAAGNSTGSNDQGSSAGNDTVGGASLPTTDSIATATSSADTGMGLMTGAPAVAANPSVVGSSGNAGDDGHEDCSEE